MQKQILRFHPSFNPRCPLQARSQCKNWPKVRLLLRRVRAIEKYGNIGWSLHTELWGNDGVGDNGNNCNYIWDEANRVQCKECGRYDYHCEI